MKPKCPKCGRVLRDVPGGVRTEWQRVKGGTTICCPCGWSRHVSRAAIIRLAVEPKKPETCKWTAGFKEDLPWYWAACGTPMRPDPKLKFCGNCGKPVEVVNG